MKIKSNIWKMYVYKFLSSFWLIAPILIPFYEENGLSATQVFVVQAIYVAGILILEIPSGYFSDVMGRKKTLIFGALFVPIGLAVYGFSSSFYGFALAELILAFGASLRSGTESALIYDTLLQLKKRKEYKRFIGNAHFYTRIGDSLAAILGGLIALSSLRMPFYFNIGSGVVLFLISTTLIEPKRRRLVAENAFKEILRIVKYCMTHVQIRSLMIYSSLLSSTGVIGVWSYYMYYGRNGISVGFFGLLFAIFCVCSALGSRQAHVIEKKIGRKKSLYLLLIIAGGFLVLGLTNSIFLIPLIFLNGFLLGFSGPLFSDYVNQLIKSDIRATVLSVSSMAGSLAFIIFSPAFGKLVDIFTLSTAYIILAVGFFVIGGLSLYLLQKHRVI